MNAIVPTGTLAIVPQSMDDAIRLAKAMSTIPELPKHCQGSVGTCLMIVDQAMRWRMSPFAVAQCSSNIKGKMMYEGKLMAAAVESMGAITGHFDYAFTGEGDNRTVTVSATRTGEDKPREMTIRLGDVKTDNEMWKKQPDQQLVYSGSRNWARRWTPAALLGAYAPEEWGPEEAKPTQEFAGATIEGAAETKVEEPPPAETRREQINREIPMDQPPSNPLTRKAFLDMLEAAVEDSTTIFEVDGLLASADVDRARKTFEGAQRERLEGIIARGIGMHGRKSAEPPEDDGWPGPRPEDMQREREAATVG